MSGLQWKTGRTAIAVGLLAGVVSCGSGAKSVIRPEQPNAAEATGRSSIKPVEGASSPLVVDWKSEQRADLEEAIHDGVAIVAWDDKGLRLMRRCKLTGDYGYLPVQIKKDVVRLETADEVKASLPLGGLGIAGKIGGGFDKGTTLDIALAMVGKRRTTWSDVKADDLKGDCTGATHYVRAILVGAFAMKTGTQAKAAAAVELFGFGGSGSSASSKDVGSADGKIEDCDKATGEETKPPGQCAAILRLELEPIQKSVGASAAPAKATGGPPEVKAESVEGCPPGFVFAGGACKAMKANLPHLCAPQDAADCAAQCNKGNAPSCDRLGSLMASKSDVAGANTAFEKACNGGHASGCANLGIGLLFGSRKDPDKAIKALQMGCMGGNARACEAAGEASLSGVGAPKDVVKALKLFTKGCEGGFFTACTNAGFLYAGGGGGAVARDDRKALEYGKRACFGGEPAACGNAGYKIELGEGVEANPVVASAFYDRSCKLDSGDCFRAGFLLAVGARGVPKDDAKAKALLQTSCKSGAGIGALACVVGGSLYGDRTAANRSSLQHVISTMKPQCDQKEGRACSFLGIAEFGLGKKPDSQKSLAAACGFKDPLGCELARKLK